MILKSRMSFYESSSSAGKQVIKMEAGSELLLLCFYYFVFFLCFLMTANSPQDKTHMFSSPENNDINP